MFGSGDKSPIQPRGANEMKGDAVPIFKDARFTVSDRRRRP